MGNSGEFDLLLNTIQSFQQESRDFRLSVSAKLDEHTKQNTDILVKLQNHDGRLNALQTTVDTVKRVGEENQMKLSNIESHTPIPLTPIETDTKKGWIGFESVPSILIAIAAVVAFVMSMVALTKNPEKAQALLTATPAAEAKP